MYILRVNLKLHRLWDRYLEKTTKLGYKLKSTEKNNGNTDHVRATTMIFSKASNKEFSLFILKFYFHTFSFLYDHTILLTT